MSSLRNLAIATVALFALFSMFLLIQHEMHVSFHPIETYKLKKNGIKLSSMNEVAVTKSVAQSKPKVLTDTSDFIHSKPMDLTTTLTADNSQQRQKIADKLTDPPAMLHAAKKAPDGALNASIASSTTHSDNNSLLLRHKNIKESKGILVCDGKRINSEVIYWKLVEGDNEFESPITPHHGDHHDKYITFEYDHGGWNNVRMGMEILVVMAHATGRTLVLPPPQHLYLLFKSHKDKHDKVEHDEMGFEDFYDIDHLKSHRGLHVITMKEFLEKEAVTGGLRGELPPGNSSDLWGQNLWNYIFKVADVKPEWGHGQFLAFPDRPEGFDWVGDHRDPIIAARMKRFSDGRGAVFYDKGLRNAHHIHFPGQEQYRLLQHHYAFTFFADKNMQSYYKRLIRDYMKYKDVIHCAGHELVSAIRADSLRMNPAGGGDYYALHVRRGDFQYKDVKLSAAQIVKNLHFPNGTAIIPPGSLVYLSTDDPDGKCLHCLVQRKPCESYTSPKPVGCPEDTSWNAMIQAGWKLRFLRDYMSKGVAKDLNPNLYGTAEVVICSRAKVFAGTFYSTFTGYIHRIRGYHGLGEDSYYHSDNRLMALRNPQSMGHGFSREWRVGWTDDTYGDLI